MFISLYKILKIPVEHLLASQVFCHVSGGLISAISLALRTCEGSSTETNSILIGISAVLCTESHIAPKIKQLGREAHFLPIGSICDSIDSLPPVFVILATRYLSVLALWAIRRALPPVLLQALLQQDLCRLMHR
ncbi:MAG: hypothetical protein ABS69_05855 [Nitrosomonadales bacterium SCN 54-20]|nr:MAG: hypothetical protein ABS69_05855 [Nitrosomonadales bacterium SCN 54-20]